MVPTPVICSKYVTLVNCQCGMKFEICIIAIYQPYFQIKQYSKINILCCSSSNFFSCIDSTVTVHERVADALSDVLYLEASSMPYTG